MSYFIDITGNKYNKLTVIKRVENAKDGETRWLCKCNCGNTTIVAASNLKNNNVKSCGCLNYENRWGIHFKSKTRLYNILSGIKTRCLNKNNPTYKNYGGRGITVCQEWLDDFMNFYNWAIENGYEDKLTIDRIDNNGNYEPNNCRWVTPKVQSNNVRTNLIYEFNGKSHTLTEWCELYKMPYKTVYRRIKTSNLSFEQAITKPIETKKRNKLYKGGISNDKFSK